MTTVQHTMVSAKTVTVASTLWQYDANGANPQQIAGGAAGAVLSLYAEGPAGGSASRGGTLTLGDGTVLNATLSGDQFVFTLPSGVTVRQFNEGVVSFDSAFPTLEPLYVNLYWNGQTVSAQALNGDTYNGSLWSIARVVTLPLA